MDLFGVGLAAVLGFLAGIATLFFTKRVEHRQWLRDKRQESYVAFFDSYRLLINFCAFRTHVPTGNNPEIEGLVMAARPTLLSLVAPDPVRDRAEKVYGRAMWLSIVMAQDTMHQPHIKKSWEAAEELLKEMEVLCRADLGKT